MDPIQRKPRKPRKPRAPRQQRLYTRRWCKPCVGCGEPIVFLQETRPPINGKPRPEWVACELYGTKNGELAPWDGSACFNPAVHVPHTDCPLKRRRLSWILRQKEADDI